MRKPRSRAITREGPANAPSPTDVLHRPLFRATGISGLTALVLLAAAVAVGYHQEPPFDAPAAEFLTHYRSPDTAGSDLRSFLLTVGSIAFVWFVVMLTTLLRRAEGEPPWRSTVALVSGALLPALVLSGSEVAAALRADDLDPQIARYAFDESQAAFANARVALGSFAICCGWVIASTRMLPRWLGWVALMSGAGLALSRISWTSYVWLPFYGLFWLWLLVVALLLIRRSATGGSQERTG